MSQRGYLPQAPIVTVIDGQAGTAELMQDVVHAQATADNARQMVLNRDPRLTSLEAAVTAGDATHAAINQRIDALDALTLKAVKQIEYRDAVPVPAVGLVVISATVDVTVTWATPFSDTDYVVLKPAVTSSAVSLLGKTDAVVVSKTASNVLIRVTTTAVLSAGAATLSVLGYKRNG